MLTVMLLRRFRGHRRAQASLAFEELAAWYWHFVDVVWLLPLRAGLLA
jgi:cytochrome c oxidase subunit 3